MSAADETPIRGVFRRWWYGLTDAANDELKRDRGAIARLRRIDLIETAGAPAPDVVAALTEAPFRDLLKSLQPHHDFHDLRDDRVEDLVTAAVTLARLREDAPGTTARLLGGRDDSERAMKEGRFLALMRVESSADLFDQARRLPALLGARAPIGELGASLLLWRTTPWVRRNWARDYYHLDLSGRERRVPATPPSGADQAEA